MPIYDVTCHSCGYKEQNVWKRINDAWPKCPNCWDNLSQDYSTRSANLVFFKEGWYEHLTWEPQYVTSMSKLKDLCKEHDCTMPYTQLGG